MEDEKKLAPVVQPGKAKLKKHSEASKFAKMFLSDDAGSTKEYVVEQVIVPKAKDLITSVLKSIVDSIFYGRGGGYSSNRSNASAVSYRDYYEKPANSTKYYSKATPMFDDIIFETPQEASEVCARMEEIIDQFKFATYGNLYDLAGLTAPYTAENYGWSDFRNAKVIKISNGYIIKLPAAMPID